MDWLHIVACRATCNEQALNEALEDAGFGLQNEYRRVFDDSRADVALASACVFGPEAAVAIGYRAPSGLVFLSLMASHRTKPLTLEVIAAARALVDAAPSAPIGPVKRNA